MHHKHAVLSARKRFTLSACAYVALLIGPALAPTCASGQDAVDRIGIGFDGHILLGQWVICEVEFAADLDPSATTLSIEATDGDGIAVRYQRSIAAAPPDERPNRTQRSLVRIGKAGAVTVRVLDAQNRALVESRFSRQDIERSHQFDPATSDLTVVVGAAPEDREAWTSLFDSDVVAAVSPTDVPRNWLGLESVRTLVILGGALQGAASLDDRQVQAIDEWVLNGGRLLVSCSENAPALFSGEGPLVRFAPGEFLQNRATRDSGPVELYSGSNEQLVTAGGPPLPLSAFQAADEYVSLRIDGDAFLTQRPYGLGWVSFLGLDLDAEPLKSWADRGRLVDRALMNVATSDSDVSKTSSGRVLHYGYEDLSGQLWSAMDRFSNVSFVTFTFVAVLIVLFILAIGPGDYFFLRRVVKRMEWTWLTLVLLSLGFCGLIMVVAGGSKSAHIEVNQVEVIDVDVTSGVVRGSVWCHVYSPTSTSYDLAFSRRNQFFGEVRESWTVWQGLPGDGLGGMQARNNLVQRRRPYDCLLDMDADSQGEGLGSTLNSVSVQTASSKAIQGRWISRRGDVPPGDLRQNPTGIVSLIGTITNPLDVRLDNCVLLYHDWAYILTNSLDPGETIDVETETREKTLKGYFTRRQDAEMTKVVVTAWKPTDTSVARIMDMIMFHEAAGGTPYTTLTHEYQPYLDLSDQLRLGRAILIGQVRDVTTPLQVDGQSVSDRFDMKATFVRVVLPVRPRESRRSGR